MFDLCCSDCCRQGGGGVPAQSPNFRQLPRKPHYLPAAATAATFPSDIREGLPECFSYCSADLRAALQDSVIMTRSKNRGREMRSKVRASQTLGALSGCHPSLRVSSRQLWFAFSDGSRVRGHADGDHLHGLRAREGGGGATGQFQQPPQSRGVPAHRESRPITVAPPTRSLLLGSKVNVTMNRNTAEPLVARREPLVDSD